MRAGLGWRAELGAGILANLDRIDVVEILAEDFFAATRAERRAVKFLQSHVPVVLHATSLGLASTEPVDRRRLDALARVVEWLEPEVWSEHLAFVRAGGSEVGHLAAPPRNDATLEGLMRNVEAARRATGSLPCLENVASLIEPPFCTYDEGEWLRTVVAATGCELLLDLHNLHTNATNFGFDAFEVARSLPAARLIHIAGGRRIEGDRVLDDHLHPVPSVVYELLACVDAREATVILERDGRYPPLEELLEELEAARIGTTRASRSERSSDAVDAVGVIPRFSAGSPPEQRRHCPSAGDSAPRRGMTPRLSDSAGRSNDVMPMLARLYTDHAALDEYLRGPNPLQINRDDLRIAARSFARKRAHK